MTDHIALRLVAGKGVSCRDGDRFLNISLITNSTPRRVAVVYQALPPPVIDGLRKDAKPGGYSDSGADIAFGLRQAGIYVVTPSQQPDPGQAFDWVFPDTEEGLLAATEAGANVLWANTVLFRGHPIERHLSTHWIVGQLPERQQAVDDKFATNACLQKAGLPVAQSLLIARHREAAETVALSTLTEEILSANDLAFPLIVKPVRGRGSQGVSRVHGWDDMTAAITSLFDHGLFGDRVVVEQYLPGEELTITVLSRGLDAAGNPRRPLVLPPVRRFNHDDGIAPYNGSVAVTANSLALTRAQWESQPVEHIMHACARAFDLMGGLAPFRIDCRADQNGRYRIFDVNMKPNMTGAGRPGRQDQDSLSAIAAREMGWSFPDLLLHMLDCAWRKR